MKKAIKVIAIIAVALLLFFVIRAAIITIF